MQPARDTSRAEVSYARRHVDVLLCPDGDDYRVPAKTPVGSAFGAELPHCLSFDPADLPAD